MHCEDISYYSPLHLSGELESRMLADIELHLSDCFSCRVQMCRDRELDSAIQEAILSELIDAEWLAGKIKTSLEAGAQSRKHWYQLLSVFPDWHITVSALLGLAFALCGFWSNRSLRRVYAAIGRDHTNDLVRTIPEPDWHLTPSGIEYYLIARLETTDALARIQLSGYRVLRAGDCQLADEAFTHVIYTNDRNHLSLYLQRRNESLRDRLVSSLWMPDVDSRTLLGLSIVRVNTAKYTIFLVGDMPVPTARSLATKASSQFE